VVVCVQRQAVNVEIGGAGGSVEFNSGVKGGEGEGVDTCTFSEQPEPDSMLCRNMRVANVRFDRKNLKKRAVANKCFGRKTITSFTVQ
jgi:hypothetical protein